jgi:hypothetical protein
MVPFVMMKTRPVKTVAKLGIANTTAQNNAISLLTSFAEFAEMRVTWPEIARTDNVVPTGGTKVLAVLLVLQLAVSVLVMLSTESMSHSCKNFLAAGHLLIHLGALKLALEVTIKDHPRMMSSPGSVDLRVPLLPGKSVEMIVVALTTAMLLLPDLLEALLHPGQEIVTVEATIITVVVPPRTATVLHLLDLPALIRLLGLSKLQLILLPLGMVAILLQVITQDLVLASHHRLLWEHHLVLPHLQG